MTSIPTTNRSPSVGSPLILSFSVTKGLTQRPKGLRSITQTSTSLSLLGTTSVYFKGPSAPLGNPAGVSALRTAINWVSCNQPLVRGSLLATGTIVRRSFCPGFALATITLFMAISWFERPPQFAPVVGTTSPFLTY